MELSPAQREQIYLEESSRREQESAHSPAFALAAVSVIAVCCLAALVVVARKPRTRCPRIQDLRAAYEGLSPDEIDAD
jgi:hypothetical protein